MGQVHIAVGCAPHKFDGLLRRKWGACAPAEELRGYCARYFGLFWRKCGALMLGILRSLGGNVEVLQRIFETPAGAVTASAIEASVSAATPVVLSESGASTTARTRRWASRRASGFMMRPCDTRTACISPSDEIARASRGCPGHGSMQHPMISCQTGVRMSAEPTSVAWPPPLNMHQCYPVAPGCVGVSELKVGGEAEVPEAQRAIQRAADKNVAMRPRPPQV